MGVIYLLIALVLALTLHEFAHAYVSNWLGDTTARDRGRLTLDPRAHIDPFTTLALPLVLILIHSPIVFGAARPVPFNPWAVRYGKWGAAMVAVAGPLTNLLIAVFCALWLRFFNATGAAALLIPMITVNIGFFVFNLIPFPPLDGSRVLYAAAPIGVREVMDRIERSGFVAIIVFMVLLYPFLIPVVSKAVGALLQFLVPGTTGLST